jgi:GrpB-like predicted nucleotidyltransferase (UPF0157 family)
MTCGDVHRNNRHTQDALDSGRAPPQSSPVKRALGLESGTVLVVPYDAAWPALFAAERTRIENVLSSRGVSLAIEHTGSTAVEGLAAKPVLDILAGRTAGQDRAEVIEALEVAGYLYRGEQGIAGRDFFRRGEPRQYHLHLAQVDSEFWREHRLFRDYLRTHPDVAGSYASLKLELAARHPRDREAYIDGKTSFVRAVLEQQKEHQLRRIVDIERRDADKETP